MHTLTLRFSRPEKSGDMYRLELAHLSGEASGTFTRPFDDATWLAVTLALDPAFDLDGPLQFSTEQRAELKALLAPLQPLMETAGGALLRALLTNEAISMGTISGSGEQIEEMHRYFQQALPLYQAIDDLFSLGRALVYYGDTLTAIGDQEAAKRRYAEALFTWHARGLEDLIGQHIVPRLVQACGSVEAAQAYLEGFDA